MLEFSANQGARHTHGGAHTSTEPAQLARRRRWEVASLGSYDIHCHCLPGLDDGPTCIEDSIALCRALIADGVAAAVATPHLLGRYDTHDYLVAVRGAYAAFTARLQQLELPLKVHLAAEVRLDERIPRLLAERQLPTLGARNDHLLLELPNGPATDPLPLIEAVGKMGVRVIIAHPERHRFIAADPSLCAKWTAAGATLQVTAGSLCGDFGPTVEAAAWDLLTGSSVEFIASDAHDLHKRPPRMKQAHALIAARFCAAVAQRLCVDNPRELVTGQETERGWRSQAHKRVPGLVPADPIVPRRRKTWSEVGS